MPIYEYECSKCGRFEVVQKVADQPATKNPECCQKDCPNSAERVMSAPSFHLKGTGWYKTDYKPSGSAGTANSSASNSNTKAEGSAESASSSTSTEGASSEATDKTKTALKTSGGGGCGSGCGCH